MALLSISVGDFLNAVGISTNPGTYKLNATRDESNPNNKFNQLTWGWPAHMLELFGTNITMFNVTIQRSTSSTSRPNLAVVYGVGNNMVPAVDSHWRTIKQWTSGQFFSENPTSYNDPWSTQSPVAYRLIVNLGKGVDPVLTPYVEMTWNVALVIPPQAISFNATGTGNNATVTLLWTPPDISWWDFPQ